MSQGAAGKLRPTQTGHRTLWERHFQTGNQQAVVFPTLIGNFEKYKWKRDSLPPPQGSPFLIFLPRINSSHILTASKAWQGRAKNWLKEADSASGKAGNEQGEQTRMW